MSQYVASTVAVVLSGVVVSRWGFRFAIKTGLVLMSAGVGLLLAGPKGLGCSASRRMEEGWGWRCRRQIYWWHR